MNMCIACKRPIHVETRTVAMVDGEKTILCCPTCARTLREQRGKQVEVIEVTDHASGKRFPARQAYVVVGSDVNHCMNAHPQVDTSKQPIPQSFDRCAPSMIAFRELNDAREFQEEHGGELAPADFAFAFGRR